MVPKWSSPLPVPPQGEGLDSVFQRTNSKINSFGRILPASNTVTNGEQIAPRCEDKGQMDIFFNFRN